jgi:hypothetical protein
MPRVLIQMLPPKNRLCDYWTGNWNTAILRYYLETSNYQAKSIGNKIIRPIYVFLLVSYIISIPSPTSKEIIMHENCIRNFSSFGTKLFYNYTYLIDMANHSWRHHRFQVLPDKILTDGATRCACRELHRFLSRLTEKFPQSTYLYNKSTCLAYLAIIIRTAMKSKQLCY